MKVKCIENKRNSLTTEALKQCSSYDKFPLIVGKEYVVYALSEFDDYFWFCLWNEQCYSFPIWEPSLFFEISDARLSRYWIFAFRNNFLGKKVPFFGIPEWANSDAFYDNLTESEDKEIRIFSKYRELMEVEFPDRSISEKAQIGDDQWLMCPLCIDAWEEPSPLNAMVTCPLCKKMMHNPRYKDELPHF